MIYPVATPKCDECRINCNDGVFELCDKCLKRNKDLHIRIGREWNNKTDFMSCFNRINAMVQENLYTRYREFFVKESVIRLISTDQLDNKCSRIIQDIENKTLKLQEKGITNFSVVKILNKRDEIIDIFEKITIDEQFKGTETNLKRAKLAYLLDILDRVIELDETL